MAGAQDLQLDLGHITLAAMAWGPEDGYPVLALHGWLDNAASFVPLAARLKGIRLVAIDFAGHGHSEHRPAGAFYHLLDNIHDLVGVCESLGWQQCGLLGHSMGGAIASLFAGAFPQRVSRLGLIEALGPYVQAAEQAPVQLAKSIGDMLSLTGKSMPCYPDIDAAVRARQSGFGTISPEAATLLVERGLIRSRDGYTWCSDARLRVSSPFRLTEEMTRAFLSAIDAPVCLCLGRDGFFDLVSAHQERVDTVGDIAVHWFDGGHHLHMEAACDEIAAVLQAFYLRQ